MTTYYNRNLRTPLLVEELALAGSHGKWLVVELLQNVDWVGHQLPKGMRALKLSELSAPDYRCYIIFPNNIYYPAEIKDMKHATAIIDVRATKEVGFLNHK